MYVCVIVCIYVCMHVLFKLPVYLKATYKCWCVLHETMPLVYSNLLLVLTLFLSPYIHISTYIHIYMHTCIQTDIHTYIHTCTYTDIDTDTYTDMYTHTDTYTKTHWEYIYLKLIYMWPKMRKCATSNKHLMNRISQEFTFILIQSCEQKSLTMIYQNSNHHEEQHMQVPKTLKINFET